LEVITHSSICENLNYFELRKEKERKSKKKVLFKILKFSLHVYIVELNDMILIQSPFIFIIRN